MYCRLFNDTSEKGSTETLTCSLPATRYGEFVSYFKYTGSFIYRQKLSLVKIALDMLSIWKKGAIINIMNVITVWILYLYFSPIDPQPDVTFTNPIYDRGCTT